MKTTETEKLTDMFASMTKTLNDVGVKLEHDEIIDLAREFDDLAADCMIRIERRFEEENDKEEAKHLKELRGDSNASRGCKEM